MAVAPSAVMLRAPTRTLFKHEVNDEDEKGHGRTYQRESRQRPV